MPPGNLKPYFLHTRPRSWPILFVHMAVGYLLACGAKISWGNFFTYLAAAAVWSIFGNGGGVALNSAYDHDKGDITFLKDPPPPPRRLALFGFMLMLIGLLLALYISWQFFWVSLICLILGCLYSIPPFRFKTRPGLDVMTNAIVYGSFTAYAGWAAMNRTPGPPMVNLFLVYLCLGWGFIPLNQVFQVEEDRQRGDRTWAVVLGKKRTLGFSLLAVVAGNGFLFYEVSRHYWGFRSLGFLALLGLWMFVLIPWFRNADKVDTAYEQRGMYLGMLALALTDVFVVLAMAIP